jgi:hypothetical protein
MEYVTVEVQNMYSCSVLLYFTFIPLYSLLLPFNVQVYKRAETSLSSILNMSTLPFFTSRLSSCPWQLSYLHHTKGIHVASSIMLLCPPCCTYTRPDTAKIIHSPHITHITVHKKLQVKKAIMDVFV